MGCWIATPFQLEDLAAESVRLKTESRYLLSGRDCPLQTGNKNFKHTMRRNPGYFMLITSELDTSIRSFLSSICMYTIAKTTNL